MYTLQTASPKFCIQLRASVPQLKNHSDEYNLYRRQLGIVYNNPLTIQQYLNTFATGWKGDPYALLQRQAEMAQPR